MRRTTTNAVTTTEQRRGPPPEAFGCKCQMKRTNAYANERKRVLNQKMKEEGEGETIMTKENRTIMKGQEPTRIAAEEAPPAMMVQLFRVSSAFLPSSTPNSKWESNEVAFYYIAYTCYLFVLLHRSVTSLKNV